MADHVRYLVNLEKRKADNRAWRLANRERDNANHRVWNLANSKKRYAINRAWRLANPEKFKASNYAWRLANPERVKANHRAYQAARRHTDPGFRVQDCLSRRLTKAIRLQRARKSNRTVSLLGCSIDFLRSFLEKQFQLGMSWENYGRTGWHIDHIRPCASFDLTDPAQQKICFHYTNLQPLWAVDNLRKSAKFLQQ